jgi:glutamate racemase
MAPSGLPHLSWTWATEDRKLHGQKTCKIGVFDSGLGGLTVYKQLLKKCPDIEVIYFADMKRQPYGPRSQSEVAEISHEIMSFMRREGCGLCIIACNTATAAVFDNQINELEEFEHFPIFGTIPFASQAALEISDRIGVIATKGTCDSGAYVKALGSSALCIQAPCPEFAMIVEHGQVDDPHTLTLAKEYMTSLTGGKIDALIYGCTHYPLLSSAVTRVFEDEPHVKFIDPAVPLVEKVQVLIEPSRGVPHTRFLVNKDPEVFAERAKGILGYDIASCCELVDTQLPSMVGSAARRAGA